MSLRIAITGSTGLIGTKLVEYFGQKGHRLTRIVRPGRHEDLPNIVYWDIRKMTMDREKLEGHDAVIHLAGAGIAEHRWSPQYKKEIMDSRLKGTELLVNALQQLQDPPKVLLCASAMGFYGNDRMDSPKDESAPPGEGFLSDVCRAWEKAAEPAETAGIRVVTLRTTTVLSERGGALAKMLPVFKLGLGGKLGRGEQPFSWICLEEIPHIISYLIDHEDIRGPVNLAAPSTVTNAEFTKILGDVLRRPVIFPVPAFGLRLLFGEMGEELLLNGVHVVPRRLRESGYGFKYPDLRTTLQAALREK
jgi:hypothetical protein